MADTAQTLGSVIRAARKNAGKTQRECAEAIGISVQFWSQIVRDYSKLAAKHVRKLATFLAIDSECLLTKKDILPLLRLIVECSCPSCTARDLEVLMDIQDKMPNPMSPALIAEILKNRHN